MPGRRRYHYYDDEAESHDELVNPRPVKYIKEGRRIYRL